MGMPPKAVLPSVRNQWHSTPYAFGMLGNFDYVNEGVIVLDDGTIWFHQPEMGGPAHLDQNDYMNSIGTITPRGWTKWSGDHWTSVDAAAGAGNGQAMADEYYIWNTQFPPVWNSYDPRPFVTDGRYIYYLMTKFRVGGFASDAPRFYRLDPTTGLCTWIAGTTTGPTDSHDGKLVQLSDEMGSYTCDREYLYWTEPITLGGAVRRMKLEPPYPVETLFTSISLPFNERWDIGSDGFPKRLGSDYLGYNGSEVAMGVHGDYLYFLTEADLRRIPKTGGGSVETIIYGGKNKREDFDSKTVGWSDIPGAGLLGWIGYIVDEEGNSIPGSNLGYPGIPDLDGLYSVDHTSLKAVGNRLFFLNSAGSSGSNNTNWWGRRFSYFDMDVLLDTYASEGPQRPNRENPQWETISNGTALWEAEPAPRVTHYSLFRACGYIHNERAGSEPLHSHPGSFFDFNPNAVAPWNERLVFSHMMVNFSGYSDWLDFSSQTINIGWGCSYLEETNLRGQFDLSLQFTGDSLKGYAAAHVLRSPTAPDQVNLVEVNSG